MFKFYRSVLAAGVVALGLAACGDNVTVTNPPPVTPVVHSVSVVPASATVTVGQAGVTFVASVNADSGKATTVSWTSTNQTVATVSATGLVTALAPGQTTIVATSTADNGKTGAGSLTVVALPPNIASFTVTPSNGSIAVGGTLQANSSVTLTPGAPAATVAWTTSNANIASVGPATGTITGVSAGSAIITATATSGTQSTTQTIGVVVGSGPTGVISFSIAPAAATLFAGQTQQITSTITVAPTFTAPSVTWTSSAPSVASVSGTGLVTAQAQGTAVISATIGTLPNTLTQTAVITVGVSSSISINSVTAGATAGTISGCSGTTGAPVILTDVNCQIDVNLNLNAGSQPLDSLTVWFTQGSTVKKLARQNYVTGGIPSIPSSGLVTLSVNSSNFTKVQSTGVATVDLWNGPTTMTVQVWPHLGAGGSVVNCQIGAGNADPTCSSLSMIFTNADGWSADINKCSDAISPAVTCPAAVPGPAATPGSGTGGFAVDVGGAGANTGKTYWGGPKVAGHITAELYAVVYNDNPAFLPGSSLNRCANQLGNGTGCISNVNWNIGSTITGCPAVTQANTPTATVFKQTFGTTGEATVTDGCSGHQNILSHRDNVVVLSGNRDAQNNSYPSGPLIPNTVVFGATPDSMRLDWAGPSVGTPDISRNAPAVTGWVNAGFSFMNFGISDGGVGPNAASAGVFYNSVNCPTVVASGVYLPHGTGADINGAVACPTNFIGGAPGLGGTAPWTVYAGGNDLLGNASTSGTTSTFGTDYTAPSIRWGIVHAAPALLKTYGQEIAIPGTVDSTFGASTAGTYSAKPTAANTFRAEYLDERSGFYNAGQPLGGVSAQAHQLSWANHIAPTGGCGAAGLFGSGPVGAAFVTNPSCGLVSISGAQGTLNAFVRIDGWQPGIDVLVPTAEAYYGYKTNVTDAAGNVSSTLLHRVLVNTKSPFSTGLGIPAVLTPATFNFLATASDSAELSHQSLQIVYPNAPVVDSLRYARVTLALSGQPGCGAIAVTAYMDDCISSPFAGNIQPVWGTGSPVAPAAPQTPYVRGMEIVDATAFPGFNTTGIASFPAAKPTKVQVWAWNWGGAGLPAGFPAQPGNVAPTPSTEIAIPALNVQNGATIVAFNAANPTIAINHWRVITTVGATNQFGSTVTLRAQAVSPTNSPNPPFIRVDFYRLMDGAAISAGVAPTHWNYLGSAPGSAFTCTGLGVCASDQGTYRSWVYQLPNASFVNAWNTNAAQAAVASTNRIIAVGVVASGDAISTLSTTMIP